MSTETKIKLYKTVKGALIAGGGVALTYFLQTIGSMDFGSYSAVIAGIASVLINFVNQFTKHEKPL